MGDVSRSPSVLERLEHALAARLTNEPVESTPEDASRASRGVVLRGDSAAAKVHGRDAPPAVDGATRVRILERLQSAMRRAHVTAPSA